MRDIHGGQSHQKQMELAQSNGIIMSLQDIHKDQIVMLKLFDEFCSTHNLEYFLDSGTLLGAIRHKGFIPWDDDADLAMLRADYAKLINIANENPYIDDDKRYKLLTPLSFDNLASYVKIIDTKTVVNESYLDSDYPLYVWVDIFCLDYLFEDEKKHKALFRQIERCKYQYFVLTAGEPVDKRVKRVMPFIKIAKYILKKMGRTPEGALRKICDISEMCPTSSNRIGNIIWGDSTTDQLNVDWYKSFIRVPFESLELPVPENYREVLTSYYGDYMQLPPREKRKTHSYEAYLVVE